MKKKNIIKKEQEFTDIIHNCKYEKNKYFVIYYKEIEENLLSLINRIGAQDEKK